jgi:hypothetical protein
MPSYFEIFQYIRNEYCVNRDAQRYIWPDRMAVKLCDFKYADVRCHKKESDSDNNTVLNSAILFYVCSGSVRQDVAVILGNNTLH